MLKSINENLVILQAKGQRRKRAAQLVIDDAEDIQISGSVSLELQCHETDSFVSLD